MGCFLCGKEIGWLRSAVDRQYCCDEHRREARMASSQVLREEEEEQELWSVSRSRAKKENRKSTSQGVSVFLVVALVAIVAMTFVMPHSGATPAGGSTLGAAPSSNMRPSLISRTRDSIGSFLQASSSVTLHHDFSTGMRDWNTVALHTSSGTQVDDPHDWKRPTVPSLVAPGSLRLWASTTQMKNYQMDFSGAIEKRSLSWAFRATNASNYYAAKIAITKPGPAPNASLVRYVMMNGREMDRVQLPLPLTLERGQDYHVRVAVNEDHFITYLDNQVISSWKDSRLTRGGVGFFADSGDEQKVAWVNLSERDSFVGQMLAHFSLFLIPGSPALLP